MWQIKTIIFVLLITIVKSEDQELFDEQLSIYQYQNNKALLDFSYKFSINQFHQEVDNWFASTYPE